MRWIDTHTHLYAEDFTEDIDQVLEECRSHGIDKLYLPNIDTASIPALHDLVKKDPDLLRPMMGLHPTSVNASWKTELAKIKEELFNNPDSYVAVGEIGTDLYWDKTFEREMEIAFRDQIQWAIELKKPIVIHSRDSLSWNIGIVEEYINGTGLTGIFHCFNGTEEEALRIRDMGFLIGIGGVITFKNAGVDKALVNVPLDCMVMETDAPYLTPTPHRGKRNKSGYIPLIGEKLAQIKDRPLKEVAEITTNNALQLFGE